MHSMNMPAFNAPRHRHPTLRQLPRWVAVVAIASASACATLDKIGKASEKLEEGRLQESLSKKSSEPTGQTGPVSALKAVPSASTSGRNLYPSSENHQTVVISNPFAFAVSFVQTTVQGCGFLLSSVAGRPLIPAQGQLALTIVFHPAQRRACSGLLLLEIDSAGGRFTRVPLKGRGV